MKLTDRAQELQGRALKLIEMTGWPDLFSERFGTSPLTGSTSYGLMVWPDIDMHMPVAPERRHEWAALLADLAHALDKAGCWLHKAEFLDDYVDPHPLGAGLYCGLQFVESSGRPTYRVGLPRTTLADKRRTPN